MIWRTRYWGDATNRTASNSFRGSRNWTPRPTNTASPNLTKNILIGFFFGIALSAAIVTVRFMTDDKIKTMDDVQKYTGLAVLAIVPSLTFVDKKSGKANSATKR